MAVDRKAMQEEVQAAKERRAQGTIRWLKKDAVTNLRVLEFPDENGRVIFARAYARFQYPGGKKSMMDRQRTYGLPCAATQVQDMADEGKMESPFDKRRTSFLVKAIDTDAKGSKIETWEIPMTVWEAIAEHALSDEWKDVLEPEAGHVFSISKSGSGLDTEYKVVVGRQPWPVSAKLLEGLTDPLYDLADPGIEGQCAELGVEPTELWPNYEDLGGVLPFTPGEAKKKSKASKAAKAEPEEAAPAKTTKKTAKKAAAKASGPGVGEQVEAQYEDGEWYPGVVTKVAGGRYHVDFEDGDSTIVGAEGIRTVGVDPAKMIDPRPPEGTTGQGVYPDDGETYPCKVMKLVGTDELKVEWDDGSPPSIIPAKDFTWDDIPFETAAEDDDILPGAANSVKKMF